MQVISGKYRGRKLVSIDSRSTRPTLARVKESMFAMVDFKIPGSVVLDLFAGSGSLGLEALSRGAEKVYFVEHNLETKKIIEKNLARVNEPFEILNLNYLDALKNFVNRNVRFDLVFLDPPYASDFIEKTLDFMQKNHLLKDEAIIVCEQDCKKCLQIDENKYRIEKTRAYGLMKVNIYKYIGD